MEAGDLLVHPLDDSSRMVRIPGHAVTDVTSPRHQERFRAGDLPAGRMVVSGLLYGGVGAMIAAFLAVAVSDPSVAVAALIVVGCAAAGVAVSLFTGKTAVPGLGGAPRRSGLGEALRLLTTILRRM